MKEHLLAAQKVAKKATK